MASMFSPTGTLSNIASTLISTWAFLARTLSNIAPSLISACAFLAGTLSNIAPSLISACASLAGGWVLLRSIVGEVIAEQLRSFFHRFFRCLFTRSSSNLTLVIKESSDISTNEVHRAAHIYLPTIIGPKTKRLGLSKTKRQKKLEISIEKDEEIEDIFKGIQLKWKYKCTKDEKSEEKKFFELSFNKQFKDEVVNSYIPLVLAKAEEIKENSKVVKIHNRNGMGKHGGWGSMILEHPATFDTLAMDPGLTTTIKHDLERFRKRGEFYKNVGKSWKRGYLLYGPPGTGKSSLIAAMANYLKFDIYDLELGSINSNLDLRDVLISTTNRSIIVIEDIDCSVQPERRKDQHNSKNKRPKFTLSGLLNFIDGLWSSCGDERIIVFTTNHKDSLDPALLRPGRMDMHIELSYCTVNVIRALASKYLNISIGDDDTWLKEIEGLIQSTKVTPAEVTEELMRIEGEGAVNALKGLVQFLKDKRSKCDKIDEEDGGEKDGGIEEANSLKVIMRRVVRITRRRIGNGATKD